MGFLKRRKKSYKPIPLEPEYIRRLVCSDTGLLANIGCPTVEIAKFIEGKEPLDKCAQH